MDNLSRLTLIILLTLLLAGVVYGASAVMLSPADSITVRCAGQHQAVAEQVGGAVVISCEPSGLIPAPTPARVYLPAVTNGS